MKLMPLCDESLNAYRRLGYRMTTPPRRAVLIEHEGALVAGAELLQIEDGRLCLLTQVFLATWVSEEVKSKALYHLLKGAEYYCAMTGQGCLLLGETELQMEGWSPTSGGLLLDPFRRVQRGQLLRPSPPVAEVAPPEPQEPETPAEPEDEPEPQPERPRGKRRRASAEAAADQ